MTDTECLVRATNQTAGMDRTVSVESRAAVERIAAGGSVSAGAELDAWGCAQRWGATFLRWTLALGDQLLPSALHISTPAHCWYNDFPPSLSKTRVSVKISVREEAQENGIVLIRECADEEV